jgi:two-component system phosphate regulon sensor histidine kinase PhoR
VSREDELGELARILNHSADELQQRLAELARDRGRTDAILSAMDDGVLAADHRGVVTLANPRLTSAMALSDPLGRHYLETIRQPEVAALVEDVLRTGARREAEIEILQLRRSFAVTGVPFPGAEGAPHGAVLTFNDTTERQRLDAIRRDFVANASHELRTPLTSIRGFVEALEDGARHEPGTAERFLGKIRTHADRMAALVEDLLELSRLESGARAPEPGETRPAEVAADVVASFAQHAARKPLALHHQERGAPSVLTDRERLRRILENLVDNAVKYTPAGGHVVVTTRSGADGSAEVEVRDDGPGIEAEHRERVFERFYRVDKARSRELGGTGLGLAIVKHLAESIGAQVTLASEPGHGSTFTVLLPPRPGVPPGAGAGRGIREAERR